MLPSSPPACPPTAHLGWMQLRTRRLRAQSIRGLRWVTFALFSGSCPAWFCTVPVSHAKDPAAMSAPTHRPGLPDLADPIQRAFARASADAAQRQRAYQALLSGDLARFPFVADFALAGKPLPTAQAGDTANARFFRELFEQTPAPARDEFLRLALRGQLGSAASLGRSPRVPLAASAGATQPILRYLSQFQAPQRPTHARGLIGERLMNYATYPHPTLVRMAGDLGLRAALPSLERFLALKRHFHLLRTDYSTHPEEVDALFVESLRAVVRIGAQSREAEGEAKAILQRRHKQALSEQSQASLLGPGEPITLEIYDDHHGQAEPSSRVQESVLSERDQPASKAKWLALAEEALAGDPAALRALHRAGPQPKPPLTSLPGAEWTVDCDEPQAALADDRLYLLTRMFVQGQHRAVLWALETSTGRTRFLSALGVPGASPSDTEELQPRSLHIDSDGSAVVLGTLRAAPKRPSSYLFRFASDSGEVSAIMPLPAAHSVDPELITTDADGYLLRHGPELLRLARDGSLRARWPISAESHVLSTSENVLVLDGNSLRIIRRVPSGGHSESSFTLPSLLGRPTVDSAIIPLILPDGFALAEPESRQLSRFRWQGTLESRTPLPEGVEAAAQARGPLAHRTLRARGKLLVIPSLQAPLVQINTSLSIDSLLVTDAAAYIGGESALQERPLSGGPLRRLPDLGSAHMARVVAASKSWVIVAAYKDGYHVGALRRSP
jgi:hypothetical protein